MTDQLCVVTGATAGIGLATTRALAQRGATVVLVARNPQKGERTIARLRQATGNPDVDFIQADLSSLAEVRDVVASLKRSYDRLDVLVNNVGSFFAQRRLSADGFEMTLALNYLGVYLLTRRLLDALKASAPARIVNVASDVHRQGRIHFENLGLAGAYGLMKAYAQSKLALVLFTYELARRLERADEPRVTVNAVHPGLVATDIWKGDGWWSPLADLLDPLFKLLVRSPEKGAETVVYLAASPEVAGVSGKYFFDQEPVRSSPASYDEETARRLWAVSAELVGLDA
jgi:NAD(P)-dependent dehydrogenase (short-subunit alcohol dehydrogenase family)